MKKTVLFLTLVFLGKASDAQNYVNGYYYTNEGKKVEGKIHHVFGAHFGKKPDNFIFFKNDEVKKLKLMPGEISSFVRGKDSFTVKRNFSINEAVSYDIDFVKVLRTGRINLYMHYTDSPNEPVALTYIIEKDGVINCWRGPAREKLLEQYFGDNKAVMEKARATKPKNWFVIEMVDEYNKGA